MVSASTSLRSNSDPIVGTSGTLAHISARVIWGAATFYFSMAASSDSLRLFEQRICWAFLLLSLIAVVRREWTAIWRVLLDPSALFITVLASLAIATNWFVVIWCAKNGELVAAGIGFFVAPLLMILSGALLFSEATLRNVALSLALCAAGVILYFWGSLAFPWPVFAVAISTTTYTLLRKIYPLATLPANVLESGIALIGTTLIVAALRGPAALLPPAEDHVFYYLGLGIITSIPMLLYVYSLPYVPMLLIGYLQYVTPTIMMGVALLIGETVTISQIVGLCLIWLAALIYLVGPRFSLSVPR